MQCYAIIPARGGSKSIPKKNILAIGGFPLIAYSIATAQLSKNIDRCIVSTDSEEIADMARAYGADVPFLRPVQYAQDDSPDREFALHALTWLQEHEGHVPELLVHLRPTSPLRHPEHVDEAIELLQKDPQATSLRSGHVAPHTPYKWFGIKDGYFEGLFPSDTRPEYHNLPRQAFPPVYKPNGYVDVLRSSVILNTDGFHGEKIRAYMSPDVGDIDLLDDARFTVQNLTHQRWAIHEYLKQHYS